MCSLAKVAESFAGGPARTAGEKTRTIAAARATRGEPICGDECTKPLWGHRLGWKSDATPGQPGGESLSLKVETPLRRWKLARYAKEFEICGNRHEASEIEAIADDGLGDEVVS